MKNSKGVILKTVLYILAFAVCLGCTENTSDNQDFFPGKYPGKPIAKTGSEKIVLSNDAIAVEWGLQDNSIVLNNAVNKYDQQTADLGQITLFEIEFSDKERLTNLDFQLQGKLRIQNLAKTDSLPTKALGFSGKEIVGRFVSKNKELAIVWKAQLRNGSNYIRQNIKIETVKEAVQISKITFLDGKLEGAVYAGTVLGSPIEYMSFFFGLMHPIAHSKALLSRQIGRVQQEYIDVSEIIDAAGEYTIAVEHRSGGGFNMEAVALFENGREISKDEHPLNGKNGSSLYHLKLKEYKPDRKYQIYTEVDNLPKAGVALQIYRKTDGVLNFFVNREDELSPGKTISEWSVIGISPPDQKRRAFQYYLERERARPYKQFLHYNSWWDLSDPYIATFTSEQLIECMQAWNKKFIEPYGVNLNSFVFDDGWDDLDSLWYFDPVKFPNGFAPQAELCKKYNSGIGVWMSPFGGYLENRRRRLISASREGLEINDGGLSLAGENYYNRFLERSLDMLNNYKVNFFKYDGFGGAEPKFLPDMEAGTRLIKSLRQHNPDVYISITIGSWPSPYWLKYADCIWRQSSDASFSGKGSKMQQFITYRDGTVHNNIVKRAPYYPINSLMTAGIVYAKYGESVEMHNDSNDDFSDMVWSFFGTGTSLQELYISHDRMKPEFWPVLADAAKWSKENEAILQDVHWIGGSPINLEVYGFAAWKPGKGIITLRNPSDKPQTFVLDLNKHLELTPLYYGDYKVKSRFPKGEKGFMIQTNKKVNIELNPFETIVYEVTEGSAQNY